jgi:peptidoglycan/xylan/chitin deacetylase (PgdA/CDA1 family)
MYINNGLTGASLPDKTLCLTFDDGPGEVDGSGPGPHTLEVAQYLSDQGVKATFFMVGKFASDHPEFLPQLENLGHLVGNHTYDHSNLVHHAAQNGDVIAEVTRVDGLIRNWIDASTVYMRPPYGAWDPGVANSLNANLTASLSHLGPIGWDIDGGDWNYWMNDRSPQDCLTSYLHAITPPGGPGRGIILMHDCTADMEYVKRRNRALDLVQLLVPALQQQGYQFARVDEVPDIINLTANTLTIALKGSNGLYVSPQGGGGGQILVNGPAVGAWEPLILEDLFVGRVAVRAVNGQYISPQGGGSGPDGVGGDVLANGPAVGDWEPLDLISLGGNQVAFRSFRGNFLRCSAGASNALTAGADSWLNMQADDIFTYEYL